MIISFKMTPRAIFKNSKGSPHGQSNHNKLFYSITLMLHMQKEWASTAYFSYSCLKFYSGTHSYGERKAGILLSCCQIFRENLMVLVVLLASFSCPSIVTSF